MHTCTKCKVEQDETAFSSWPRNKWCRGCAAAYRRALRKKGYRPSGRNKRLAELSPERRELLRVMTLRRSDVLQRQRRYGTPGTAPSAEQLAELWDKQGGKCALTGYPLVLEPNDPYTVSVDQRVAGAGYDLSNCQLVGWAPNRAKGDLTHEDFVRMCVAIARCNDYPERE